MAKLHVPFNSGWIPDLAVWLETNWRGDFIHKQRLRAWGTSDQSLRNFLEGRGVLMATTLYRLSKASGIPMERLILQQQEAVIVPPQLREFPIGNTPDHAWLHARVEVSQAMKPFYIEGDFRGDGFYLRASDKFAFSFMGTAVIGTGIRITNSRDVTARVEALPEFPYDEWRYSQMHNLNQEIQVELSLRSAKKIRIIKKGQRFAKLKLGKVAPIKFFVFSPKEYVPYVPSNV